MYHHNNFFGERWYLGTADAVFQNLYFIEQERPKLVLVLSGDHIYKMDYMELIESHLRNNADITVSTTTVEKTEQANLAFLKKTNITEL